MEIPYVLAFNRANANKSNVNKTQTFVACRLAFQRSWSGNNCNQNLLGVLILLFNCITA